ncbi:hypothetical protein GLOTRDRAFT_40760 [Gloeophyllum trabeum ATCC 11539]|uniref:Uncharacterized protein n=1 Tax=Gloeophyllum trabeum (strain ATCC 11539 / FP-39264 / Madison 617) TaxID=670483 RepID=S7Q7X4_GLOTA|nr:uncharacterized protein GLOTRDRAFT_40760 [Gloeophyllum trabeum ATCC 11539]EPQ55543.1 hypothetical protein GLOTRDRAFT_40760 [Gloeophyllum trabeum ATCC 11539]
MDLQSLNMNTLASSLPPSNLANAEKDLMDKFKAAALSITTLYRSSRATSKKAYNAGYAAACQDLLLMIQQGVSDSQMQEGLDGEPGAGMGMTIGRVMDWVEARLEAVKAREEEEDEEEERSRPGVPEGSHSNRAGTSGRDALSSGVNGSKSTSRPSFQPKEQVSGF